MIKNWWVVLLVSRFICLKSYNYPTRFLWGWFHRQSPGKISCLCNWDWVALNHAITNWETWFWLYLYSSCFSRSFGSTWGAYQDNFVKTTFPASAAAALKIASLSIGQVFVAVKKWESCIYFQRKLHLCAGSCIYAHIWLQRTWHNLFSFARTWTKVKIFHTSTSNWVRALSYLTGFVKLLACNPTVSS